MTVSFSNPWFVVLTAVLFLCIRFMSSFFDEAAKEGGKDFAVVIGNILRRRWGVGSLWKITLIVVGVFGVIAYGLFLVATSEGDCNKAKTGYALASAGFGYLSV